MLGQQGAPSSSVVRGLGASLSGCQAIIDMPVVHIGQAIGLRLMFAAPQGFPRKCVRLFVIASSGQ
jgi:hypothetical protein